MQYRRLFSTLCDKFNLYISDQSLCPLCLEWFIPLPRPQDCILEYILPTKPGRAYRRAKTPRATYFFTVVTYNRHRILCEPENVD